MREAHITQDEDSDAVYISFQDGNRDRVAKSFVIEHPEIMLDLDEDGHVIGIELLGIHHPLVIET